MMNSDNTITSKEINNSGHDTEVAALKQQVQVLQQELSRQRTTLSALCNVFSSMYSINLRKRTLQKIISEGSIRYVYLDEEDADVAIESLLGKCVSDDYRAEARSFVDIDTIDKRVGNKAIIMQIFIDSNGEWKRYSIIPIDRDEDGRILRILLAARKITEEIRFTESRNTVIHALSLPFVNAYGLNGDTGEIDCYRMGLQLTDSKGRKVVVRSYEEAIDAYVSNNVLEEDRQLFDKIETIADIKRLLDNRSMFSFDYRVDRNDTTAYFRCVILKPIPTRNEYVVGFRNVDEETRQQLQWTEELERQREIIEGLGSEFFSVLLVDMEKDSVNVFRADYWDGMLFADTCKRVDNCWSKMVEGYSKDIVTAQSQEEFVYKMSLDYMKSHGRDYSFVYETSRPDIDVVYYEARVTFVRSGNHGVVAVVGTRNVDRVVKKEREQERIIQQAKIAEASNKAKTDFLFNMSHDIRTPMNAIIGFTELMKKHIDDRELVLSYLDKISTSNSFLLSIINNVLEMARIDSGKVTIDEEPCNVHTYLDSLYNSFEPQMQQKNIRFESRTDVLHPDVMADGTKLRQIFLNIVSNSLKYTPAGGNVKMSMKELPSEQRGFAIYQTTIEDNGIGMSKEFLPHIFQEFEREHTSTVSKVTGTGLGMSIVKKLIDLMGGTIEVESELGKGTKFIVSIPHRIASVADSATSEPKGLRQECDLSIFSGKRILLAEDNELNAEIAMTILEEAGFEVDHADDGVVCVDMLDKAAPGHYDLILMDVQMPNMNGYRATQLIRRFEDSVKAEIPIIAMTANAFDEDKKNAYNSGMNAHVAKPLDIDVLNDTMLRILTRHDIDVSTITSWFDRLADSDEVRLFEDEYRSKGYSIGHFVYEACGEEKILYADNTAIEIFGCQSYSEFSKHVHGSFRHLVYKDDLGNAETSIRRMIRNLGCYEDRVRYRIERKDGVLRQIDDVGHKVFTEYGTPVFYVCIVDITE